MKIKTILKLAAPVMPILHQLFARADAENQIEIIVDGEIVKPTELLELIEKEVVADPKRVKIEIFTT